MASKNPQDMMAVVTTSMQEPTGKTLQEWVEAVLKSGIDPLDQKAVRDWLKKTHQVPQNSKWAIADATAATAGWQRPSNECNIDSQYTGDKAGLRSIFDTLRQLAKACGQYVVMEDRGGYTPFVHKRQFMAMEASSKTKVTLGLRFKTTPSSLLLEDGKAPGQCTHRVIFTSMEQISPEVGALIKMAYDQN